MSVVTRHPRYAMLLGCILLGAFFLLSGSSVPADSLQFGKSLRRVLQEEDVRYEEALRGREWLIRKYGPTEDQVVS